MHYSNRKVVQLEIITFGNGDGVKDLMFTEQMYTALQQIDLVSLCSYIRTARCTRRGFAGRLAQ